MKGIYNYYTWHKPFCVTAELYAQYVLQEMLSRMLICFVHLH